jgi:hypothetical protein
MINNIEMKFLDDDEYKKKIYEIDIIENFQLEYQYNIEISNKSIKYGRMKQSRKSLR